jgi:ribosomal protein S18 acetylase RimI-like enzyme
MLGGMWGGYAVLFYLIATRIFGGWMPLGVDNPGGYATPLPFLDALRTGILPAMHEELQYRLVGISLVVLFTRRRWLALVVPGALWAFAHLTYIRDPFYLRGIELTIHAVVLAGLVFLRFDLTTTMMAHFTYNASLGALPLIRSGESFFVLSGAIVIACMLVPVAPGVALAMRRRWRAPRVQDSSPQVVDATVDDLHGLQGLPIEGVDWQTALTDPEAYVVCLRMGTEIAGVAIGRLNAEGTVEVRTVFVAPAWRREYWGSRLVDELMARMRGRGARSIQAAVPTKDTVAVAFWASQGWRQAVKVFSRPLVSPTTSTPKGFRERIRRILRKLAEPID